MTDYNFDFNFEWWKWPKNPTGVSKSFLITIWDLNWKPVYETWTDTLTNSTKTFYSTTIITQVQKCPTTGNCYIQGTISLNNAMRGSQFIRWLGVDPTKCRVYPITAIVNKSHIGVQVVKIKNYCKKFNTLVDDGERIIYRSNMNKICNIKNNTKYASYCFRHETGGGLSKCICDGCIIDNETKRLKINDDKLQMKKLVENNKRKILIPIKNVNVPCQYISDEYSDSKSDIESDIESNSESESESESDSDSDTIGDIINNPDLLNSYFNKTKLRSDVDTLLETASKKYEIQNRSCIESHMPVLFSADHIKEHSVDDIFNVLSEVLEKQIGFIKETTTPMNIIPESNVYKEPDDNLILFIREQLNVYKKNSHHYKISWITTKNFHKAYCTWLRESGNNNWNIPTRGKNSINQKMEKLDIKKTKKEGLMSWIGIKFKD